MSLQVAAVTGGSRGLGKEIALLLGGHGYNVAVNYLHSKEKADEIVSTIGEQAISIKADVSDLKQVEAMAGIIKEKWGRIDALINNAGVTRDGLLIRYGESDWDKVLKVNLKGCFNTVRAFLPLMTKAGSGHIINISSYSGLRGKAGQTAYSASKAALMGLTCSLAKELSEHNIRVNCVLPGYMPTDMGISAEEAMKSAREESIIKKLSDSLKVAEFIHYLLTTDHITGQVFTLDSRI